MNASIQHGLLGRLADLSPFDLNLAETPKSSPQVRNAVCRDILERGALKESEYGCVEWYQYPASLDEGSKAAE